MGRLSCVGIDSRIARAGVIFKLPDLPDLYL